ncbi:TFIID-31kDa-domain-containing protein [Amniculicola lignicola CBS 123094]|uniref:TFIID-31kDa-domain-containing protein n=1 Tax=Amniculicola lignicola CBS 123094 TaxID=1392246 RepID=A0A6A5X0G0_9PLEO|nr:TFIID-31kDa-domain-containing protein [Amniculicola lignicola CBS 123094]
MASPAADAPNGISTPPNTALNGPNPSPPSTQPATSHALPNNISTVPANPSHPMSSLQDPGNTRRPRDARLIHLILANMGVHAYTERVPLQLLDFAYRYKHGVLSDALAYEPPQQTSSSKKAAKESEEGISINALRTAIASRAAMSFSHELPKEWLQDVAGERNKIALPRLEREFGLRLPPERYVLNGVNWEGREMWEGEEEGAEGESMEVDGGAGDEMGSGGPVGGKDDTVMGGMEDEDVDEDEFEGAFGDGGMEG